MQFTFHSDAGHGWLFVDNEQLSELGLRRSSFSSYSYTDASGVYAEEDCDVGIVLEAAKDKGIKDLIINEQNHAGRAFVRGLARCIPQ